MIDKKLSDSLKKSIANNHHLAHRYRIKSYLNRRDWQLMQFRIGYRDDWSKDELLLVLKHRYGSLRKMCQHHPGSSRTLMMPMIAAAYDAETGSGFSEPIGCKKSDSK